MDIVQRGGYSRAVFKGKGMFQTLPSLSLLKICTGFEDWFRRYVPVPKGSDKVLNVTLNFITLMNALFQLVEYILIQSDKRAS